MTRDQFTFELPDELIARYPLPERSASRLLCLDASTGERSHRQFKDVADLLQPGDLLVFNQSRVMPARLQAQKASGGQCEILIERLPEPDTALAHVRASKSPKPGSELVLADGTRVLMRERSGDLFVLVAPEPWLALMARQGEMPLPPYFSRAAEASDNERYQTVYARDTGSVAAPTAGLHFDEPLLAAIRARGVETAFVTLHVGAGTFQPVRTDSLADHVMHAEWVTVSAEVVAAIQAAKARGNRVVAVGTTSVRALESAAWASQGVDPLTWRIAAGAGQAEAASADHTAAGLATSSAAHGATSSAAKSAVAALQPFTGDTRIFITPGYRWQLIDALITNFHLPESTLLMLVSALAGREAVLAAYADAIDRRYRFFSYGDAMFISPSSRIPLES